MVVKAVLADPGRTADARARRTRRTAGGRNPRAPGRLRICHTDLRTQHLWSQIAAGRWPVVFGHEGAGVVEAVGASVKRVRPGDTVVLSYRSCRACPDCAIGHPYYCAHFAPLNVSGTRTDGSATMSAEGRPVYGSFFGQSSFATHALAYEDNAVVVDGTTDLKLAAPLGCGVQTGAGTVMNVLELDESSSLAVFGAGGVGLSAVMAARALGVPRIVAIDPWRAAGSSRTSSVRRSSSTRRSKTSSTSCAATPAAARRARSTRARLSTRSSRPSTASARAGRVSRSASACRSSRSRRNGSRGASPYGRRSKATQTRTSSFRGCSSFTPAGSCRSRS